MSNRPNRRARTQRAEQSLYTQFPPSSDNHEHNEGIHHHNHNRHEHEQEDEEAEPERSSGHRQKRLESLLLEELCALLRDEVRDPVLGAVFPLALELTPDGGTARIAYAVESALADEPASANRSREALARATGFLRARLASQLDLKRLPKLAFRFVGGRAADQGGGAPWSA